MKTLGISVLAVAACLLASAPAEARARCRLGQMYRPSSGECMSRASFNATMRGSRYGYHREATRTRRISRREARRLRREEAREEAREAALEEMRARRSSSRLLQTRPIVPVVEAITEDEQARAEAEMFAKDLPPAKPPVQTASAAKPGEPSLPFKMSGPSSLNPFAWKRSPAWAQKPYEVQ